MKSIETRVLMQSNAPHHFVGYENGAFILVNALDDRQLIYNSVWEALKDQPKAESALGTHLETIAPFERE